MHRKNILILFIVFFIFFSNLLANNISPDSLNSIIHQEKKNKNTNFRQLTKKHQGIKDYQVHYIIASVFLQSNNYPEAIAAFREVEEKAISSNDSVYAFLGSTYITLLEKEEINFKDLNTKCLTTFKQIQQQESHVKFLISILLDLSYRFRNNGEYNYAINFNNIGIKIANNNKLHKSTYYFLREKFIILKDQGLYPEAYEISHELIQLCKQHDLNDELIAVYNLISWVYIRLNETDLALLYTKKQLELSNQINLITRKADAYNQLGCIYERLGNDSSIFFFKQSAKINKEQENSLNLGFNYYNTAGGYYKKNQLDSAMHYALLALSLHKQENMNLGIGNDYEILGNIYLKMNDYSKAEENYQKALYYAKTSKFTILNQNIYKSLSECYKKLGKYDLSIQYLEIYHHKKDSVINEASKSKILKKEITEQLKKTQKLDSLSKNIQNKLLEKQKQYITSRQLLMLTTSIIFFITLAYITYKKKWKKARLEINTIKSENKAIANKKASEIKPILQDHEKVNQIADQFMTYITKDKIYTNPNITIDLIAKDLKTNRTYLSNTINQKHDKNFTRIINELRIKEACRLLKSEEYNYLTIEGIANKVGFKSKTSFTNAFKKYTNQTPGVFKKQIHSNEYTC